jgi:hypothetical protein
MLNHAYCEKHIIVSATDEVGFFLSLTIADSPRKSTKNDISKKE